jgi:hypothetical protein
MNAAGDVLVVGTSGSDGPAEPLRVYTRDGAAPWKPAIELPLDAAQLGDAEITYGSALAVDEAGKTVVARASAGDIIVWSKGAERWTPALLRAPDGDAPGSFGAAFALSGDGSRLFVSRAQEGALLFERTPAGAWQQNKVVGDRGFTALRTNRDGSGLLAGAGSAEADFWIFAEDRDASAWHVAGALQLDEARERSVYSDLVTATPDLRTMAVLTTESEPAIHLFRAD